MAYANYGTMCGLGKRTATRKLVRQVARIERKIESGKLPETGILRESAELKLAAKKEKIARRYARKISNNPVPPTQTGSGPTPPGTTPTAPTGGGGGGGDSLLPTGGGYVQVPDAFNEFASTEGGDPALDMMRPAQGAPTTDAEGATTAPAGGMDMKKIAIGVAVVGAVLFFLKKKRKGGRR